MSVLELCVRVVWGWHMEMVGEIKGHARVLAGWSIFDGIAYRIDVWEEQHRRRIVSGTIQADREIMEALEGYGEATIDLGLGLGSFGFVVTNISRGEIKITGPVTRADETDRSWRAER